MRHRLLAAVLSIALLGIVLPLRGNAGQLTYQIPFAATGESLWGPFFGIDPVTTQQLQVPAGHAAWGPLNHTVGHITETHFPGFCIPLTNICVPAQTTKDGTEFRANTSAQLLFNGRLGVESGHVDISYPITARLNVPDRVAPGSKFTISSSFSVDPSAALTSVSPVMELAVNASGTLTAQALKEICSASPHPGGCSTTHYLNLANQPVAGEVFSVNTKTFIDLNKADVQNFAANLALFILAGGSLVGSTAANILAQVVPTYGFERLVAGTPNLDMSGSLNGNRLVAAKDDPDQVLVRWDVDSLATALLCSFPASIACGRVLELDLTELGVNLHWLIADLDKTYQFGLGQQLAFEGMPIVSLDLGLGGPPVELVLGQSVEVLFPADADALTITPTFRLPNTFSNTTDYMLRTTTALKLLQLDIGALSFGPLVDTDLISPPNRSKVFERTWELDGFASIPGGPLVIEAQASAPEPATPLLLAAALAAIAWRGWRRARAR